MDKSRSIRSDGSKKILEQSKRDKKRSKKSKKEKIKSDDKKILPSFSKRIELKVRKCLVDLGGKYEVPKSKKGRKMSAERRRKSEEDSPLTKLEIQIKAPSPAGNKETKVPPRKAPITLKQKMTLNQEVAERNELVAAVSNNNLTKELIIMISIIMMGLVSVFKKPI